MEKMRNEEGETGCSIGAPYGGQNCCGGHLKLVDGGPQKITRRWMSDGRKCGRAWNFRAEVADPVVGIAEAHSDLQQQRLKFTDGSISIEVVKASISRGTDAVVDTLSRMERSDFPVEICETRTLPPALTLRDGVMALREAITNLKLDPPCLKSGVLRYQIELVEFHNGSLIAATLAWDEFSANGLEKSILSLELSLNQIVLHVMVMKDACYDRWWNQSHDNLDVEDESSAQVVFVQSLFQLLIIVQFKSMATLHVLLTMERIHCHFFQNNFCLT
ncbi:PHYLLO protein [Nymphaea thermarum]|nr:PHYLLO protein [Nymphaea thermarum]